MGENKFITIIIQFDISILIYVDIKQDYLLSLMKIVFYKTWNEIL